MILYKERDYLLPKKWLTLGVYMMKKRNLLLVALVLFTASLFAAPVVVTWEWMLEDPNVTTFRYQLDGENPEDWIVVDSSVTTYSVKGLDGSQAYTLYLQQSYDGENFSGSAQAVSEPMLPAESEVAVAEAEPMVVAAEPEIATPVVAEAEPVVAADPVVAEAEPVVVADPVVAEVEPVVAADSVVAEVEPVVVAEPEPAVVAEAPVVEMKAKVASRYKTTITLAGGINRMLDPVFYAAPPALHTTNLEFELGLQLKNLKTFNKTFGLGVDVGLTYNLYLDSSRSWVDAATKIFSDFSGVMDDFTQAATVSAAPMLNISLGKVEADIGAGVFLAYGPEFNSSKGDTYMFGAFAKLGLAYKFNSWFSMGANVKYNFVLSDLTNKPQFIDAGIYLGFSF